jgi:hypothetical protein
MDQAVQTGNERIIVPNRRLGRLPLKTTRKALLFSDFFSFVNLPNATNYWTRKKAVAQRTFGNDNYGDCTRAKQAYAAIRMERIEQKRTIDFTDEEVIRVYREMCVRVYGSDADEGAYEDDALNAWRNPDYTFRDTRGRPYTIDAYLRINALNHQEVRAGLALSGPKGIAICINLPAAFQQQQRWHVSEGQPLVGEWQPGTWGGHSMWAIDYDVNDLTVDDTWAQGPRRISWPAVAAYVDEAHLVIDSVNAWRKRLSSQTTGKLDKASNTRKALGNIVDAVNSVSSITIKA